MKELTGQRSRSTRQVTRTVIQVGEANDSIEDFDNQEIMQLDGETGVEFHEEG